MIVKKNIERFKSFHGPINEIEFEVNKWLKTRCDDGLIKVIIKQKQRRKHVISILRQWQNEGLAGSSNRG